jgi:hypothetical protein
MENNNEYKFDRTAFKAMASDEADNEMQDYKNYSWQERLKIAAFLNSIAYNYPIDNPPRMEKQLFTTLTISQ